MSITIPVVAADGTQSTVTLADPMFRYVTFPFQLPAVFADPHTGDTTLPTPLPITLG